MNIFKHIILRMKELIRHIWITLFGVSVGLAGASVASLASAQEWNILVSVFLVLCLLCFVAAIFALIYDIKKTWNKEHPEYGIDNFIIHKKGKH